MDSGGETGAPEAGAGGGRERERPQIVEGGSGAIDREITAGGRYKEGSPIAVAFSRSCIPKLNCSSPKLTSQF